MTPEQLQELHDSLAKYQGFQWLKSERRGQKTNLKNVTEDGGIVWIEFSDGSRCNLDLMDEFVLKLGSPSDALDLDGAMTSIEHTTTSQVKQAVIQNSKKKESPIFNLLQKQKPNQVGISIELTLNLPSTELYGVLKGSFDNAEEEIVGYVLDGLKQEDIRQSVKDAVLKFYQDGH